MLIPTKEAVLNLGNEACQALESEVGRPHLAAIFRHNMFAHRLLVQVNGQSLIVDDLDRGAVVDLCFLDDQADPFRVMIDADARLSIADGYSVANVEMDAYYLGPNIIHITDTVLLPASVARFLGIGLTMGDVASEPVASSEPAAIVEEDLRGV